jgi:hypothetical protein
MMRYFLLLTGLLYMNIGLAQNAADTLEQAKQSAGKGKYREAARLLEPYYKGHPTDLNTVWLYARYSWYCHKTGLSMQLYREAITLNPGNYTLKLEYAKMLVEAGVFDEAKPLLDECTSHDISNPEAWYYLAKMEYWNGNARASLTMLDNIMKNAPDYKPARSLRDEIGAEQAFQIQAGVTLSADDQPLDLWTPYVKGGKYFSNLAITDFLVQVPLVYNDTNHFNGEGVAVGNKFHFPSPALDLYLNAGFFYYGSLQKALATGELDISKYFLKKLVVSAGILRRPYMYTQSSLNTALAENHGTAYVAWDDPDRWNGKASFEASTYSSDNNLVWAVSAWGFAPAVKAGHFAFHFGYGYNFSTSQENRYVPKETLDEIIAGWSTTTTIDGVYNPYFTPNGQQVHSALGIFTYRNGKAIEVSFKANVGFYAFSNYPYLYLDKDSTGTIFVNKNYAKTRFTPYDLSLDFSWQIVRNLELFAVVRYDKTLFYTAKSAELSLRKRF